MSVTPDTIAVALGRTVSPSDPEYAQWDLWIDDANMLIDARMTALGVVIPPAEASRAKKQIPLPIKSGADLLDKEILQQPSWTDLKRS